MKDRHRHHEVKQTVEFLLTTIPSTRESYDVLYVEYLRQIDPNVVLMPFEMVMKNTAFPSYQSVARASRAIKRENPDLRETEANSEARTEIEAEYEVVYGGAKF